MNTILVTGGAGYIGSHAAQLLLRQGYRVVIIDNLKRGFRQAIDALHPLGDLTLYEGDISDAAFLDSVFRDNEISAVMHFAALCIPDESNDKPLEYYENNTLGVATLLESMRCHGVKQFIFSSTAAVYGAAAASPITEEAEVSPLTPYGHSKLLAEEMVRYYQRQHGIRSVIFRYFNVCGCDEEGRIGDSKKPSQLLMQNAVRGALGIEPFSYTCPEVATPDGTPIRDYIDARDLAEAHLAALSYLENGGEGDLFNLGRGVGSSVKEIVSRVEQVLGAKIEKNQAKPRRGESPAIYADPSKAERILNWKARKDTDESIKALARWYQKRPKGFSY